MLSAGTAVGRYVVLDRLGEGAMGEVYRAWDNALDRVVALKLLLPLRAESPAAQKRFMREARLAARINHPCVAHVYDIGEWENSPFLAMEFVPGRQLRSEMGAALDPRRVVALGRQVLEGLGEAHRQGVVHRDLKPENILISGRDQVKILDFGLAKPVFDDASEATDLSSTGLTGTPRYMAPEQVQGAPIDPRTDVYALGALFYEMVSGRPAHTGNTLGEMLLAVVHKPAPELPDALCPPALARVIMQALEKSPENRFVDAEAMLHALLELPPSAETTGEIVMPKRPPHPRASQYTQRGREALNGMSSSSSMALDMLKQAIDIDPEYAVAHAVYAEAAGALFTTGALDATWLDKAQTALDKAEALDPSLPDVRVARARILWNKTFNFPAETALRELRLALRVDPEHLGALRLWATITGHVGLFDQCLAAVEHRLRLDPMDEVMLAIRASIWMTQDRIEDALQSLERPLKLDPHHQDHLLWWVKIHGLLYLGKNSEARQTLEACLRRHPQDPLMVSMQALVAALDGNDAVVDQAISAVEKGIKAEVHPHHAYHVLAQAESVRGRAERALYWLKRTSDEGMPCYPWFEKDPFLERLRKAPVGAAFLAELKRRHNFFVREFPLTDPATMSFVATEVTDR